MKCWPASSFTWRLPLGQLDGQLVGPDPEHRYLPHGGTEDVEKLAVPGKRHILAIAVLIPGTVCPPDVAGGVSKGGQLAIGCDVEGADGIGHIVHDIKRPA